MRDRETQPKHGPGFSRRAFLKGSGAAVAASAMATAGQEATQAEELKSNVAPSNASQVTLNVNGSDYQLELEPRVTLLEALRNDLNFTGCKEVCDTTTCGACTVIIDGKPVYACSRFAHEVQGKKIQTVESLRDGDNVDEVITGFVNNDAMQCGFCTPGFVMAVRAFLNKSPHASLQEVQEGLGGNICRCGTYHGITQCALEIARKGGA